MKILVMGGTRFFGKRLVSLLLEKNHDVTILSRGKTPDGFGDKVKRIKMDRGQLDPNHPALRDSHWDVVYDQICYDAEEARSACDVFKGKTTKHVFTSTLSVYEAGSDLKESDFDSKNYRPERFVPGSEDYREAKRQAESVFMQEAPFPVTAVRFPIVLGEDDYTERLKFHVDHVLQGKPIYVPNLKSNISFIHANDAARFLAFLADHNVPGAVNCCSEEPISLHNLFRNIESATGKKAIIMSDKGAGDPSPFGIPSDWTMNVDKLLACGFRAQLLHEWLPRLVKHYAS